MTELCWRSFTSNYRFSEKFVPLSHVLPLRRVTDDTWKSMQKIVKGDFPNKNLRTISCLAFPPLNGQSPCREKSHKSITLRHLPVSEEVNEEKKERREGKKQKRTRIRGCSLDTHTQARCISGIPQPGHVSRDGIAAFNELERNSAAWSILSILYVGSSTRKECLLKRYGRLLS